MYSGFLCLHYSEHLFTPKGFSVLYSPLSLNIDLYNACCHAETEAVLYSGLWSSFRGTEYRYGYCLEQPVFSILCFMMSVLARNWISFFPL